MMKPVLSILSAIALVVLAQGANAQNKEASDRYPNGQPSAQAASAPPEDMNDMSSYENKVYRSATEKPPLESPASHSGTPGGETNTLTGAGVNGNTTKEQGYR